MGGVEFFICSPVDKSLYLHPLEDKDVILLLNKVKNNEL